MLFTLAITWTKSRIHSTGANRNIVSELTVVEEKKFLLKAVKLLQDSILSHLEEGYNFHSRETDCKERTLELVYIKTVSPSNYVFLKLNIDFYNMNLSIRKKFAYINAPFPN